MAPAVVLLKICLPLDRHAYVHRDEAALFVKAKNQK